MDVTVLTSEVFKREMLWNQAHPDHHNRFILEKKWEEVSNILNVASKYTNLLFSK